MGHSVSRLLLLAAVTVAPAIPQVGAPAETRRYDIRALAAALTGTRESVPFLVSPVRPGGVGEASIRFLWGRRDFTAHSGVELEELLSFAARSALPDGAGQGAFQVRDGWLTVAGQPPLHDEIPRALSWLASRLQHTVELELMILPPEALAQVSGAVLDAAMADRLLEIAKPIAVLRSRTRAGSETVFEAVARRTYLKDYDVEVGQESKSYDPLVDVLAEGARIGVRVEATPDGALVLTVKGQQAELKGPPRTIMIHDATPAAVHLPDAWWGSASASARIPPGGALVIGNDLVPRGAWVVRARRALPSPPAGDPPFDLIEIGALRSERLDTPAPRFVSPNPTGAGAGTSDLQEVNPTPRVDPDDLRKLIATLRPEGMEDQDAPVAVVGRVAMVKGGADVAGRARELIARIGTEVLQGLSFEARWGSVPAEGFRLPAADQLEALADALPHRGMSAALSGDRFALIAGESQAYLKDRDVEIAQKASADDPLVDVFFTGLAMSCWWAPAAGDRRAIDVQFEYQELLEMPTAPTGSLAVPEVDLPRIAAVGAMVPLDVVPGAWVLVHTAPIEGTGRQFVLMLRVQPS